MVTAKKSCSRLLQILIVLHSKHEKSHFSKSVCVCLDFLLPCSLSKWKYGDSKKKSCSRLLQILIVLPSKHEKQSSKSVCICRFVSMANDKSRKFKQNHLIFCMLPLFLEYSTPVVFGEDR